jgi:hypothetical protein
MFPSFFFVWPFLPDAMRFDWARAQTQENSTKTSGPKINNFARWLINEAPSCADQFTPI